MAATNKTFEQLTITSDAAQRIVSAGLAKAEELGVPSTVAVLDHAGLLKALGRGDGAALMGLELAQRKAYTAVAAGGMPSAGLFEFATQVPALLATLPHQPGIALLGGGLPLWENEGLIGSVGASGGTVDQDVEIAEAAVAAL